MAPKCSRIVQQQKAIFRCFFSQKNPGQMVNFRLKHVDISWRLWLEGFIWDILFPCVNPVIRQIFYYTVGKIWYHHLKPCHVIHYICPPSLIANFVSSEMVTQQYNISDTWSQTQVKTRINYSWITSWNRGIEYSLSEFEISPDAVVSVPPPLDVYSPRESHMSSPSGF